MINQSNSGPEVAGGIAFARLKTRERMNPVGDSHEETIMFQSLLVPLDGSALGEHALPWAVSIARRTNATLRLCHVHPQASEVVLEASPFYEE